ncbi:cupin domain-containing protein [Sabulicella rubraurantiaca]|uniref:cupin domain-containing protein n=1 Tax=Sabulicella rubraurantiaca TaxID=2811429 RepID=UPI001A96A7C7|nr:cupin domain-containing protein [Sabulicella rubraurantiaca]
MSDTMARAENGTLAPEEGEVLDVFGARLVVKAYPATAGFLLAEHVVPPGFLVPPHVHQGEDEVFFMLEGELTLLDGGGARRIGPGCTAQLPAGLLHGFRNDTGAPVRFLVALRPGLQGIEMFRHFDRAGRAAPRGLTSPEIVAICAQYGVTTG